MTYSEITITFNIDIPSGVVLGFGYGPAGYMYTWVPTRYAANQVSVGSGTGLPGEVSAINFASAFNLDKNTGGIYEVSQLNNTVTIKAKSPTVVFQGFGTSEPTYISAVIDNYGGTVYELESLVFEEATTNPKCSHFKVTIETNELTDSVSGTVNITDNEDNPFSFELLRGQSFSIVLSDGNGQNININRTALQVPQSLNVGNFDITVTNSPNGGVVTILPLIDYSNQIIEYSLDNTTWIDEGQFTGLFEGDYTLYVRDNFGCSFEYDFTITQENIERLPYFKLPKSNSIRFANRVNWGVCANYKNDDNTLSCESEVLEPWKHTILFQSCDVITTQFRSNYAENLVKVIKEDGTEDSIIVNQMTQNMNVKDKRDARKYNIGNGRTGVYFISGNTYDYDTDVVNGTYALNGLLPYWGNVGNIMTLDGNFFQIMDVLFDENVNSDVLVLNTPYTGSDTSVIVSALYNIENYEEYEFTIDFFNYLNQNVRVRINSNDDEFINLVQLSEEINTKIEQEDTLEIRYKNTINTDLNFSRGLECKMRIPFTRIDAADENESETNRTDSTVIQIGASFYEADRFTFEPLVKQIMRQLQIALSHDTVTIRGVGYVKNDTFEVEGALGNTNLYVVTATMLRTGSAFNSRTGQSESVFAGENEEIVGLIESEIGYVKYS